MILTVCGFVECKMAGYQSVNSIHSSALFTRHPCCRHGTTSCKVPGLIVISIRSALRFFSRLFSCIVFRRHHHLLPPFPHRPQALLRAHKLDATDPSVFLRTSAFLLGAMVVSTSATSSQAIAPEQLKNLSTANAAVCRANVAEAVSVRGGGFQ